MNDQIERLWICLRFSILPHEHQTSKKYERAKKKKSTRKMNNVNLEKFWKEQLSKKGSLQILPRCVVNVGSKSWTGKSVQQNLFKKHLQILQQTRLFHFFYYLLFVLLLNLTKRATIHLITVYLFYLQSFVFSSIAIILCKFIMFSIKLRVLYVSICAWPAKLFQVFYILSLDFLSRSLYSHWSVNIASEEQNFFERNCFL